MKVPSLFENAVLWFPGTLQTLDGFPILPSGVTVTPAGVWSTETLDSGRVIVAFNGSTNLITISDNADMELGTNQFTLMFWIEPDAVNVTQTLFGKRATSGVVSPLMLAINTFGQLTFYWAAGDSAWDIDAGVIGSLSAGVRKHITITRIGNYFYGYVDGVLNYTSGSISASMWNNSTDWTLGVGEASVTYPFGGLIAGFTLLNGKALSETQIKVAKILTDPVTGVGIIPGITSAGKVYDYWKVTS